MFEDSARTTQTKKDLEGAAHRRALALFISDLFR